MHSTSFPVHARDDSNRHFGLHLYPQQWSCDGWKLQAALGIPACTACAAKGFLYQPVCHRWMMKVFVPSAKERVVPHVVFAGAWRAMTSDFAAGGDDMTGGGTAGTADDDAGVNASVSPGRCHHHCLTAVCVVHTSRCSENGTIPFHLSMQHGMVHVVMIQYHLSMHHGMVHAVDLVNRSALAYTIRRRCGVAASAGPVTRSAQLHVPRHVNRQQIRTNCSMVTPMVLTRLANRCMAPMLSGAGCAQLSV